MGAAVHISSLDPVGERVLDHLRQGHHTALVGSPGCGMTRAAGHLIRGNLTEALRYHPLVLLVVAELLGAWTIWAAHQAGWIRWRHRRWVDVVIGGTAALLIIVWIARLIAGTTPPV